MCHFPLSQDDALSDIWFERSLYHPIGFLFLDPSLILKLPLLAVLSHLLLISSHETQSLSLSLSLSLSNV